MWTQTATRTRPARIQTLAALAVGGLFVGATFGCGSGKPAAGPAAPASAKDANACGGKEGCGAKSGAHDANACAGKSSCGRKTGTGEKQACGGKDGCGAKTGEQTGAKT